MSISSRLGVRNRVSRVDGLAGKRDASVSFSGPKYKVQSKGHPDARHRFKKESPEGKDPPSGRLVPGDPNAFWGNSSEKRICSEG